MKSAIIINLELTMIIFADKFRENNLNNNLKPIPKLTSFVTYAKGYMASNIEMLLGVVMMGIGIGTLTKKLVR